MKFFEKFLGSAKVEKSPEGFEAKLEELHKRSKSKEFRKISDEYHKLINNPDYLLLFGEKNRKEHMTPADYKRYKELQEKLFEQYKQEKALVVEIMKDVGRKQLGDFKEGNNREFAGSVRSFITSLGDLYDAKFSIYKGQEDIYMKPTPKGVEQVPGPDVTEYRFKISFKKIDDGWDLDLGIGVRIGERGEIMSDNVVAQYFNEQEMEDMNKALLDFGRKFEQPPK